MMSDVMEIKAKADRLVELTSQQSVIKAEIDEIKAWFEKLATDDLRDTKKKTIDYWGSNNSKVVVGNSETVKPVSMTMVKKLLGDVFGDFVKEDTTYKMTDPWFHAIFMPVIIEFSKCTDIYSSAKFELFRDRIIENIWEITKKHGKKSFRFKCRIRRQNICV